jgi:hypothetical protein
MTSICNYCLKKSTVGIFPNLLKTNQETIMNGILVCDDHKQLAISKLTKLKMYKGQ